MAALGGIHAEQLRRAELADRRTPAGRPLRLVLDELRAADRELVLAWHRTADRERAELVTAHAEELAHLRRLLTIAEGFLTESQRRRAREVALFQREVR